jgi:hypothetical protein
MPRPRKPSVAFRTMARASSRVAMTTRDEKPGDRFHELARAEHEDLRAEDARVGDPARQPDHDDEGGEARAEDGDGH